MGIEVTVERLIDRPREKVAAFAMEPENDTTWIKGIKSVRVLTEPPFGEGSRVERIASFLGRRIEYVNEVTSYAPPSRLEMRSVKSPFPMRVAYEFRDAASGTLASVRVEGDATGFYRLASRVLARQVKRSVTRDLAALKDIMERET